MWWHSVVQRRDKRGKENVRAMPWPVCGTRAQWQCPQQPSDGLRGSWTLANLHSEETTWFAHHSLSSPLSCPSAAKPRCRAHTGVCGQCCWLRLSVRPSAAGTHVSTAIQSPGLQSLCTECLYPDCSFLQGDCWSWTPHRVPRDTVGCSVTDEDPSSSSVREPIPANYALHQLWW